MSSNYDNWCPEIYRSLFIDRYNNDSVRIAPCCQAQCRIESVDNFDFKNSTYLTELRQQFDQGHKPEECNSCWDMEKVGHKSRRLAAQEFYNIEPSSLVQLESIDHSATWACNMACIMCGADRSSQWAAELNLTNEQLFNIGRKFQKENNILDQLSMEHVKKIHFNGGEPFLNTHQLDLLDRLEQQDVLKDTFISYNTNGSIFPNAKIIDRWSRSRLVKLFFSIDAVESAFEYIRWPGKWNEISSNIQSMREQLPGNVMFGINLTVGSYNLLELKNLDSWFQNNIATNREGDPSDFNWQIAPNFDPKHVNNTVKHQVIEDLKGRTRMLGIINYLQSTLNYSGNNDWITKLDNIDLRRSTNWRNSLTISQYY